MDQKQIYNQIEDYANGKLSKTEIEDLWVKILENPELLSYLETIAHVKYLSSSESSVNIQKNRPSAYSVSRKVVWAVAASMIIVVGVLYYFRVSTATLLPEAQTVIPSSDFESVDVYRSVDNNLTPNQQELNQGYAMMIRHNDDQAKQVFQHLLSENPDNELQVKLFFDLGTIAYNHSHFTAALDYFNRAQSHTQEGTNRFLSEKINWYLGQTHLQLKQPQKTIDYLKRVIKYNGYYYNRADSLFSQLSH